MQLATGNAAVQKGIYSFLNDSQTVRRLTVLSALHNKSNASKFN